jgi:hypothetical protein
MAKGADTVVQIRNKMAKTHELISICYHESGHVLYGLLHYFKITSVFLSENIKEKRIWGFTDYYPPMDIAKVEDLNLLNHLLLSEICFNYSGLTAEKLFYKKTSGSDKFPYVLKMGSEEDTINAANLIKNNNLAPPGSKRYLLKKKLIKNTASILEEYWEDITLISHALFQKKRLNFLELKDLLCKKSINKVFWKDHFKNMNYVHDNDLLENQLKKIVVV